MNLDEFLARVRPSAPWAEWQKRTGEGPPDFDALKTSHGLPDVLEQADGSRVETAEGWRARRAELLDVFTRLIFGTCPPTPHRTARVVEEVNERRATVRKIELSLGSDSGGKRATLRMELLRPEGSGPFPLFLSQISHRGWARVAVERGYAACLYAGCDEADDTEGFRAVWPDHDWTRLTRRAWAASRCLDYLFETQPDIDRDRVILTGHSRNGKTSLIAGALDERIRAVIASSSGVGGACPYRLFSEAHQGEGIELITHMFPEWLHPRLRFFSGVEHKLPVDANSLLALMAPRPCLATIALNDNVESTWAVEECVRRARPAYDLFGAGDAVRALVRTGDHAVRAEDVHQYIDWCDDVFGRSKGRRAPPETPIHPYTLKSWKRAAGRIPPPPPRKAALADRVAWLLGDDPPPPSVAMNSCGYGVEPKYVSTLLRREAAPDGLERHDLSFGENVRATIFAPKGSAESARRMPAAVWVHPHSLPRGYIPSYGLGEAMPYMLARSGMAVFCYDQVGFGGRIEEGRGFYARYPRWSLMGKMVHDTRRAVESAGAHAWIDPKRVFMVGVGLGGMVALHAAALDPNVAGLAVLAGFEPFRTPADRSGGIARFCAWDGAGWIPRLHKFLGREKRVPYDFDELIATLAPRPVLLVTPTDDRENDCASAGACIERARKAFPHGALDHRSPRDYHRLSPERKAEIAEWLGCVISKV